MVHWPQPKLKRPPQRPVETHFVWIGFSLKYGEKKTHFAQKSVPEICPGNWEEAGIQDFWRLKEF